MDDKQVLVTVKKNLSWIQKHERIILAVLVLAAGLFFGNHWINLSADNAKVQATIAAQQLDAQKRANDQLAQQVAQQQAQYEQLSASVAQQNAAIIVAISARNAELGKQQQKDKTLPLPDLAKRWQALAGLNDRDLRWNDTPGCLECPSFGVTEDGARQTVIQLEQLPVLQANLKDAKSENDNGHKLLDSANGLLAQKDTQITGLQTQIGEEQKTCKKELNDLRASARKSKRNWFVTGVISGAAAVAYLVFHQ